MKLSRTSLWVAVLVVFALVLGYLVLGRDTAGTSGHPAPHAIEQDP